MAATIIGERGNATPVINADFPAAVQWAVVRVGALTSEVVNALAGDTRPPCGIVGQDSATAQPTFIISEGPCPVLFEAPPTIGNQAWTGNTPGTAVDVAVVGSVAFGQIIKSLGGNLGLVELAFPAVIPAAAPVVPGGQLLFTQQFTTPLGSLADGDGWSLNGASADAENDTLPVLIPFSCDRNASRIRVSIIPVDVNVDTGVWDWTFTIYANGVAVPATNVVISSDDLMNVIYSSLINFSYGAGSNLELRVYGSVQSGEPTTGSLQANCKVDLLDPA